jgi:hypothetical protein
MSWSGVAVRFEPAVVLGVRESTEVAKSSDVDGCR